MGTLVKHISLFKRCSLPSNYSDDFSIHVIVPSFTATKHSAFSSPCPLITQFAFQNYFHSKIHILSRI